MALPISCHWTSCSSNRVTACGLRTTLCNKQNLLQYNTAAPQHRAGLTTCTIVTLRKLRRLSDGSCRLWTCKAGLLKASVLADSSTVELYVHDGVKRWSEVGCWMRSSQILEWGHSIFRNLVGRGLWDWIPTGGPRQGLKETMVELVPMAAVVRVRQQLRYTS